MSISLPRWACINNPPLIQHNGEVGILNRLQPMRNSDDGAMLQLLTEHLLDRQSRLHVDRRRSLFSTHTHTHTHQLAISAQGTDSIHPTRDRRVFCREHWKHLHVRVCMYVCV